MLGKLLKYEFKATSRKFLPMYIAILLVSLVNGVLFEPFQPLIEEDSFDTVSLVQQASGILTFLLVALFISLGVLTIVITIQRFNKNLLGDEGYLMFTLPVSSKDLIISKAITSLIWIVLSGIVGVISLVSIFFIGLIKRGEVSILLKEGAFFIEQLMGNGQSVYFLKDVLILIGFSMLSNLAVILLIYMAIAIAQLPRFHKHKTSCAFIVFFVANILGVEIATSIVSALSKSVNTQLLLVYVLLIVSSIIMVFITSYILDKKLNLE